MFAYIATWEPLSSSSSLETEEGGTKMSWEKKRVSLFLPFLSSLKRDDFFCQPLKKECYIRLSWSRLPQQHFVLMGHHLLFLLMQPFCSFPSNLVNRVLNDRFSCRVLLFLSFFKNWVLFFILEACFAILGSNHQLTMQLWLWLQIQVLSLKSWNHPCTRFKKFLDEEISGKSMIWFWYHQL